MVARRLISGGSWAFLAKAITVVAGMAINALLARMLEPADLGSYMLIMSLSASFAMVGQFGQNQVVVRFIAESIASMQEGRVVGIIVTALMITVLGSIGVSIIYAGFGHYFSQSLFHTPLIATTSLVVVFLIVAISLRSLAAECFRGFYDIFHASFFESVAFIIVFFPSVVLLWFFDGKINAVEILHWVLASAVISALWAWWSLMNKLKTAPKGKDRPASTTLFRIGSSLMVSNIAVMLTQQAGLWIVGMMASPSQVALYGAAFRLVLVLQMPLLIFNSVVPPLIADLYAKGNTPQLELLLRSAASVALLPAAALFAVFLLWGHALLAWLYGGYYADGHHILVLLSAGVLVNAWAGFCGPALIMTGGQRSLMLINMLSSVVSIGGAFPLAAYLGADGVAFAMAVGVGLQHLLMLVVVKKRIGIWTHAGKLTRETWSTLRHAG